MYKNYTIDTFINELSGKAPTPGGGGASALAGALAAALGSMVAALTIGKKSFAAVEEEIIALQKDILAIKDELLLQINKDEEAFKPLAEAYRLPQSTPEEEAIKEKTLEICSQEACTPPYEIMCCCARAIDIIDILAEKGSKMAVSDAGCAAVLAKSAMQAAALNVYINTKSLKNRGIALELNTKVNDLLAEYSEKADMIYENVVIRLTV